MRSILSILLLLVILPTTRAQKKELTRLFRTETPLEIKLRFSVKDVKKITNDTIYTASVLHYKDGDKWDSVKVDIRARGNFRRANCYFPPLRVKIKKEDGKGTVFEGNRSLKLVLPCKSSKDADNDLIMKEFVCYQMFEPITEYYFNTRLTAIDFTDLSNKKVSHVALKGFFIEDDDVVAKRHGGKIKETKVLPQLLDTANALRHDLFQYMIANTDVSTLFMHNAKIMDIENGKTHKYIPLTYDFDMAGFVNAPYAEANEMLGISSVRERLYRGFCRDQATTQRIRKEIISKEQAIMGALKAYESSFQPKDYAGMVKYMEEFFVTMKDDGKFATSIKCRTQ